VHELALCQGVIDVAREAAGDREIARVKVRVGQLQRVLPESWDMCWQLASMDTPAQGSTVELSETPARIRCQACGAEGPPAPPLDCAACGDHSVQVLEGNDIVVEEVELVGGEVLANPALAKVASVGVED
jgi:hydrogenase nickel incorporation protein HypA/HybF